MAKKDDRFQVTYTQGSEFTISAQVWVDRETGVNYLFMKSGYGAGLTPILNRDGKPVVTTLVNTEE